MIFCTFFLYFYGKSGLKIIFVNARTERDARLFPSANKTKRINKMKKNVKTIMGGFLSVALLAGFISCSNGTSDETNQAAQGLNLSGASSASGTAIAENIYSGDLITFKATAASVDSENVNLIIKYDRSAAGAKELISLTDVELEVKLNGTAISMPSTIKFELDEYGALFDNKKDSEHYKEYKSKLSINKKIVSDDTVTVQLKKAKVSGEGAASVKLDNVLISLIDTAPTAGKTGYYNELCPNNEEYKPLITKKNGKGLNEVETPAPAVNTNENNNTNTNTNTDNNNTNTNTDNNNTNTNNNNATPAATTPTPVTVTNCKQYTVKLTKAVDASVIGYVLQIDNDGTKDADGLKIDVTNLTISVKVGDGDFTDKTFDAFNMIPNQWANPAYGKTDCRKRLGLTGSLTQGTEITVKVKSATISNSAKAPSIIFALQEDCDPYGMLGTESGENQDIWLPAFATN